MIWGLGTVSTNKGWSHDWSSGLVSSVSFAAHLSISLLMSSDSDLQVSWMYYLLQQMSGCTLGVDGRYVLIKENDFSASSLPMISMYSIVFQIVYCCASSFLV